MKERRLNRQKNKKKRERSRRVKEEKERGDRNEILGGVIRRKRASRKLTQREG